MNLHQITYRAIFVNKLIIKHLFINNQIVHLTPSFLLPRNILSFNLFRLIARL